MLKKTSEEYLQAHLFDLARKAQNSGRQRDSAFLDEHQLILAKNWLGKKVNYCLDGGYPQAQRVRLAFLGEEPFQSQVVCLGARIDQKFVTIHHRDVLGALMALDFERDQFGDLWVLPDQVVCFCTPLVAPVIIRQCTQVHRLPLQFSILDELPSWQQATSERTVHVNSLRLDNLVCALIGTSRGQAKALIRAKKVSLNHEVIEDCDKICHNMDTLSISGSGRFVILDEGKMSRKNRHIVMIRQYR